MAIFPPEQRIWWKEQVERTEILWVAVALIWALIMFFMMPYWHIAGKQNLSNEAYKVIPEHYAKKVEAEAAKYKIREEDGVPVVAPPPGSDVYILARLWEWWPILQLKEGQSYRLHLSSMDYLHGFSLQPININIQVHPEYDLVTTITPTTAGTFSIVCNEYCGIGHHTMVGRLYVTK